MDNIIEIYNNLVGDGISIIDLYIYDRILNDDYNFGLEEANFKDKFEQIKENYSNDYECRSLEYHIDSVLNGYGDEEEWD